MRTPNRRLQVFVSSTFSDLRDERQAAVVAILREGHIPAGMELFGAESAEQMAIIREWIEESDVFLLLLGGRYGSVGLVSSLSYTELEYEHALKLSKPVLSLLMTEEAIKARERERPEFIERDHGVEIRAFRARVMANGKMADFFASTDALDGKIGRALKTAEKDPALTGWIRGTEAVDAAAILKQMTELRAENDRQHVEIERLRILPEPTLPRMSPLARRPLTLTYTLGSDKRVDVIFTRLQWFVACGHVFVGRGIYSHFRAESTEYFCDLDALLVESMTSESIDRICRRAVADFVVCGWIEAVTGDVWDLTIDGRAILLEQPGS